jgi:hypothetical protein
VDLSPEATFSESKDDGVSTVRNSALRRQPRSLARMGLAAVVPVSLFIILLQGEAAAETRLYYLRVTLRSGERYETISAFDPINYCYANAGSVRYLRGYPLLYSAEMKVKVMRTWMNRRDNLTEHWSDVLRENNMLSNHNRKPLPRVPRLTMEDMLRPELQ